MGPDTPLTASGALQEKYIITVEMWAYTGAIACVTHHDVIEPPAREKSDVAAERGDTLMPLIKTLYQKGPLIVSTEVLSSKWTLLLLPDAIAARDQPTLDVFFHCEPCQFIC